MRVTASRSAQRWPGGRSRCSRGRQAATVRSIWIRLSDRMWSRTSSGAEMASDAVIRQYSFYHREMARAKASQHGNVGVGAPQVEVLEPTTGSREVVGGIHLPEQFLGGSELRAGVSSAFLLRAKSTC